MTRGPVGLRTARGKIVPPRLSATLRPRPRLLQRLAEAKAYRLTTLVAGAGFGKSTLLGMWVPEVNCAWYTLTEDDRELPAFGQGLVDALRLRVPDLTHELSAAMAVPGDVEEVDRAHGFAGLLCEELFERLSRDLVLVLDGVEEVPAGSASAAMIEDLCRQCPPDLHIVLASRSDPPFRTERLRGRGEILEVTAADLTFSVEEVADLLDASVGSSAASMAQALHEATGGWPAALRLVIETLRANPDGDQLLDLEGLRKPGGPLFAYLAEEVFRHEPSQTRVLLRSIAPLARFTPELCEAVGAAGSAETIASLARRGLFIEPSSKKAGWFSLNSLVREFALNQLPLQDWEVRELHERAVKWLESRGHLEETLESRIALEDHAGIVIVLSEHGHELLASGAVSAVLEAADVVPAALRTREFEQVIGEAFQIRGDLDAALECFERAAAEEDALSPAIAWRMGMIYYLRGEIDDAIKVYGRSRVDGSEPRDEALLLAWMATAHWLQADAERCAELAGRALEAARKSGDSQALAAAHTIMAMLAALEGDRSANDLHYLAALDHAEAAGDVLQITRIRANRASHFLEEGAYEEALAELEISIRLADLSGLVPFRALGLLNRGEAYLCLGRLEEAVVDFEAATALYQRLGSKMVCYPLAKLGDVHRHRGQFALARASYEEAVSHAEDAGDLQGLVPALAGLARALALEDPDEAERVAQRALAYGPNMGLAAALLAAGWVALARGDRARALERAEDAAVAARARRDRAGIAEALELRGLACEDPELTRRDLAEAASIWREIRNPVAEARTEMALARVENGQSGRARAERARRRMRTLGVHGGEEFALESVARAKGERVAVLTLGGFRVVRDGEPVPVTAWQSKKARELLKVLVARRGRPVQRELLMDVLWPDEDPAKLGNRLSVALATVRTVLDPNKEVAPDHYIVAADDTIALDLDHVLVDVELFLEEVTQGLELVASDRGADRVELLQRADVHYTGDFLEENLYDDWAVALREEARAAYVRVAWALADHAVRAEQHDDAVRQMLRILERDAYDEKAHLALVSAQVGAGRHGEARRAYRAYCRRMDEIGVEAAPDPGRA